MAWRAARWVAVMATTLLAPAQALAGEGALSPLSALDALPWPSDPEVSQPGLALQRVRRLAEDELARAQAELGRQAPFDRDDSSRQAVAYRLSGDEAAALLAMEVARSREPFDLARPIQELARAPRVEDEGQEATLEESLRASRAACGSSDCARKADRSAQKARADLLQKHRQGASLRMELLHERLRLALSQRLRLIERVATATSDPYLQIQARGLLAESWRAVAELSLELEREAQLVARLSGR